MPRKGTAPTWDATGSRHDRFINLVTQKNQTVEDWKAQLDAARAQQRGTTGVYNPQTGEREYAGTVPMNRRKRV